MDEILIAFEKEDEQSLNYESDEILAKLFSLKVKKASLVEDFEKRFRQKLETLI